jgi:ribosomal protein S18 acetylase RimI-like enzyme
VATGRPLLDLQPLEWDTEFFGARMGVIVPAHGTHAAAPGEASASEGAFRAVLARARAERYAHLIFRSSVSDAPSIWAAERAGMRLVDVGIDSTFRPGSEPLAPRLLVEPAVRVRPARSDDVAALQELAGDVFTLSRFAVDPFFSEEQVRAFHRTWVANLYAGMARAIFVCEVAGQLAGFVTCAGHGDAGRIPLIATDGRFRRRGVGRGLLHRALRWFEADGATAVHVKTQANNYPALALYHQAGFRVAKTELTFSLALAPAELPNSAS